MLILDITIICLLAFMLARWLDRRDEQARHHDDLAWARREAARAELDILNDGSWPAYWIDMQTASWDAPDGDDGFYASRPRESSAA